MRIPASGVLKSVASGRHAQTARKNGHAHIRPIERVAQRVHFLELHMLRNRIVRLKNTEVLNLRNSFK